MLVQEEEGTEGAQKPEGSKDGAAASRLFDSDNWNVYDSKDNVFKEAEEIRKTTNCKHQLIFGWTDGRWIELLKLIHLHINFSVLVGESSTNNNLFGSKIKEEPVEPQFEDDEDCMSDEFGEAYCETYGDGDGYDEDDTFCHSKSWLIAIILSRVGKTIGACIIWMEYTINHLY